MSRPRAEVRRVRISTTILSATMDALKARAASRATHVGVILDEAEALRRDRDATLAEAVGSTDELEAKLAEKDRAYAVLARRHKEVMDDNAHLKAGTRGKGKESPALRAARIEAKGLRQAAVSLKAQLEEAEGSLRAAKSVGAPPIGK